MATVNTDSLQVSAEDYYGRYGEYMSAHRLMTFRRCPAEFKMVEDGEIENIDKPSLAFGRAAHAYILEGERVFEQQYIVSDGPINSKTDKPYGKDSKKYLDWRAELGKQELEPIENDEFRRIKEMNLAVKTHQECCDLMAGTLQVEATIRQDMFGVSCQSRVDCIDFKNKRIIDLKTCDSLGENHELGTNCRFVKDFWKWRYDLQLAFYSLMAKQLAGDDFGCSIIAVEKLKPYSPGPFRAGVFHITPSTLEVAQEQVVDAFREFKRCRENNTWPTRFEKAISI